ncbi:MAG: hypothetical protein CMB99_07490 [Flavobacteriaceae bacterium]|nr:hypothetical protein [Flavobacteriaceae bacterium]|tara:strand:+ start:100092 stop:101150 length:1059 start_codon:yes stop_codon:yes gene_type:complete
MIKFFRKIRQKLLAENRFNKYLLYAFGEIILVVIGILIALQINNWNEQQANEERIKSTLRQVQKDLLNDIEEIIPVVNYYDNKLILLEQFVNVTKPKSFFEENFRDFSQINLGYRQFIQSNQAFLRLKNQVELLPDEYNPLLKSLNRLYIENAKLYDFAHSNVTNVMLKYKSKLYDNFRWMEDYQKNNFTPEIKNYFLNSEANRKQLIKTKDALQNQYASMGFIKDQSVSCYLMLKKFLQNDSELPEVFDQLQLKYRINTPEELIGNYTSLNSTVSVELRDGILYLVPPKSASEITAESFILQEIGKDTLAAIIGKNTFMKFNRDAKGEIEGFAFVTSVGNKELASYKKEKK